MVMLTLVVIIMLFIKTMTNRIGKNGEIEMLK